MFGAMKRPYVVCHMMGTVDGRILTERWSLSPASEKQYEAVHALHKADAWLCGRKTFQGDFMEQARDAAFSRKPKVPAGAFIVAEQKPGRGTRPVYAIAVDPSGKIRWESNVMRGDLIAGRAAFLRALAISPAALDNFELLLGVGLSYLVSGEYEQSLDWSLRSLAANPDWLAAYWMLAAAYGHLNRLDEGRDMIARLLARSPGLRLKHIRDGLEHQVVLDGLRKAGMPK